MNGNRLICAVIGALLLATPASAWTGIPTPTPTATPTVAPSYPTPTPTPTTTPKAEATGAPTATPTATPTTTPTAVPRPETEYRSVAIILIDAPETPDGADSMFTVLEATDYMWDYDIDEEDCYDFYQVPPYAYAYDVGHCGTRWLWLNATFGIIDFVRDSNSDTEADVWGPYESALNAQEVVDNGPNLPPCNYSNWVTEIRPMVYADEPDVENYDHQMFVLPWQNPHPTLPHNTCNFGGYGSTPGDLVWANFPASDSIAHELGHNLNLHHCDDKTDLMCAPGRVSGLNGGSLIQLGVLHSSHVVEVSSNESVVLLPMSVDPYDYPGLRVLKVISPAGDPYYIDFHDDTGVDEHLREENQLAAGVNRWSGDPSHAQEFKGRIKDGETFIPVNGSFSVEVTDLSAGQDHLEMTLEVIFFPPGVLARNWRLVR